MSSKKVIFMGTPGFAVPVLKKLLESEHEVIAVYTAPPKPAGRGKGFKKSQIHQVAEQHNIKIFTPQSLKNEELPECDIAVVAAYGILLPKHILEKPKFGCINIHPSLLPRWRGAAPIQRMIMAGDSETAVCIMQMDQGLDTGDVLAQQNFLLSDKITAGELHDKCATLGAELVLKMVNKIETSKALPQPEEGITYARKITKNDERINWAESAEFIERQIRGLNPFPGAYFEFNDERIKVFAANIIERQGKAGELLDNKLLIACGKAALQITQLQRPGKRLMSADEFLRGFNLPKATVLK